MLSKPLYLRCPGKYFQIGGYWVPPACGRFEAYTLRFRTPSGFNDTLPDSGRRLPPEGSALVILLTSIAMRKLRNLMIRFPSTGGFQPSLSRSWPTTGRMGMHTFLLVFPGQVLSNCWLLDATGMRTLRGLYHSISCSERTAMRPFPTLTDICPLRYQPFSSG